MGYAHQSPDSGPSLRKFVDIKQPIPVLLVFIACNIFSGTALSEKLDQEIYSKFKDEKGTVLVAVNWGRLWGCGKFENAQLEKLGFESGKATIDSESPGSEILLESPSRVFVDNKFVDYGFIVEPGEYYLSEFSVKVAKSSSDVGYHAAGKDDLVKNGKPEGGMFTVNTGETVYIGHFFLDCYYEPVPWRFYPDGRDAFEEYKRDIKKQFPYIDESSIKFRLFKSKYFGHDYEL